MLEVAADQDRGDAGLTVSDSGLAFDPLSLPAKGSPKSLDEASRGGLGLPMLRHFSDWMRYRHEGGRNQLAFGVRWSLP